MTMEIPLREEEEREEDPASEQTITLLYCPFCEVGDFDKIGLKLHLAAGHCDPYNKISLDRCLRFLK